MVLSPLAKLWLQTGVDGSIEGMADLTASTVSRLRADFPILQGSYAEKAYLDWAATAQRPRQVLDAERLFLETANAAVHRGASVATGEATNLFEDARLKVGEFVGATGQAGFATVWTQGATDALNLLATAIGEATAAINGATALGVPGCERFALGSGDEILVTEDAHHANLIPWQRLAARTGATLKYIPVSQDGVWSAQAAREAINSRTRIVAFTHVSNVTGAVAPVAEVVELARQVSAVTVLDACQSVPHIPVDVAALGVDFAAFSGHKMLGPNGLGVFVGREELLACLPPARTGGSAITRVTMEKAEFLPPPQRFEPGTQPVSQVVALGAAVDYLQQIGMAAAARYEHSLVSEMVAAVSEIPGVRLLGPQPGSSVQRVGLVAVVVDGVHAHDVGQYLDSVGVTVRVGHHCAQPLHRALGVTASTRASVHVTSTSAEVARFVDALSGVRKFFGVE